VVSQRRDYCIAQEKNEEIPSGGQSLNIFRRNGAIFYSRI
jgi:hypothetical protein